MLATTLSATLLGLDAELVRVETEVARGVPSFELVGLAEAAVRESRVRVKSALAHLGVDLSEYRVVVNLGPADVKKAGSAFDLAIAIATLAAIGLVPMESFEGTLLLGELSLAGTVQSIRGALPQLLGTRRLGVTSAVVPRANQGEAGLVSGVDVRVVQTLEELVESLRGERVLPRAKGATPRAADEFAEDMADVAGQTLARRALEIAAAGGHNLLMVGSPGAGKTMLARRLPTILPSLYRDEALEVAAIHSVAGLLTHARDGISFTRPFRAPHHTISEVGLVGGGDVRPGEVSLAHQGVLFLDELPEFRRGALEALRQPVEDGCVTITRAYGTATFPARPLLVGAMNPCPCGYFADGTNRCACTFERVRSYRGRVSGPLLDRIDVQIALLPVKISELGERERGESSAAVQARVVAARGLQKRRFDRGETTQPTNAALSPKDLMRIVAPRDDALALLDEAAARYHFSARGYGKILRVARTIADLAGDVAVAREHVGEAVQLRLLDRSLGSAQAA